MVFEVGYGHHKRTCLYGFKDLNILAGTCTNFLSLPGTERRNANFESSVAQKIIDFYVPHMFDGFFNPGVVYRIELTIDELQALVYCAKQVESRLCHLPVCLELAESSGDYLRGIICGVSGFDRTAEKPLRAKMRRI